MQRLVTDRIFASALDCTYKCFLLLNDHHGTRSEYEQHAEQFDAMYQTAALNHLRVQHSRSEILCAESLASSVLTLDREIVVITHVKTRGLASDTMVLIRNTDSFEPVFFFRYEDISSREKLLLAYKALVFGKATGIMPTHAQIIHGDEFTNARVNLTSLIPKAERIIHDIDKLSDQKEQPLFLCAHCDVCQFLTTCRTQAIEEDNMSLLQGMYRTHIEEQNKKGIFTLHQFSHTFRPRRAPKRAKNPSTPRHFALQAQALRENKVYIHGTPTLPSAETTIYFDIEGIPGRHFYYLIGMLVITDGKETHQYFWADGKSQQADIFRGFCESVATHPGAALFHYGQYDVRALRDAKPNLGNEYELVIDNVTNSCHNVLSVLHPHCYFPVYSNRLRDVARFLGYEFEGKILTGIESIMYRERWEKTRDTALKDALIAYNKGRL